MNRFHLLDSNIRTLEQLSRYFPQINPEDASLKLIAQKYPFSIPEYYLSLINPEDKDDPIRKMCIPSFIETSISGSFDTSGEAGNTIMPGLQHKYPQTVLLLSTNHCAMYCRYCFRKRMVGSHPEETVDNLDAAFSYIKNHQEISNVLISGGDSFMLDNGTIETYLSSLCNIEHLDYIRFGTKTPVVFPQRIYDDPELLEILKTYNRKKPIYISTQFNHPRELTPEALRAIACLQDQGLTIKNQTVLLKGVNDTPQTLGTLLKELTKARIIPYYVFQCRPVTGVKDQFQVPLKEGFQIVEKAKMMQNGNGKCFRYIMSNIHGKLEILGESAGKMFFKYHQAKDPSDYGRIFSLNLSDDMCWIE